MARQWILLALGIVGSALLVQCERVSQSAIRKVFSRYDTASPPSLDNPTTIRIGVYVNNVQLDYQKGSMRMNTYLRMSWQDERFLALFNATPKAEPIRFTDAQIDQTWRPDLFIRNSDKVERVNALVVEHLLRVNSTGRVWFVVRMIKTVYCPNILRGHRSVNCPIMFESYGHTMDTLHLAWLETPVDVDPGIKLLAHTLHDVIMNDCSQNYTAGQFPCLEMVFKMRRDLSMNTFEAGIFLSSTLLVLISWLGFWTPHGHQRVFLGLGTSLVFAILFVSVIAWRPYSFAEKTSTAQLWLTMCFAFSLGMVLEYALVYVLLGVIPAKLKRSFGKGGQGDNVDEVPLDDNGESVQPRTSKTHAERPSRLAEMADVACGLVIFPVVFVICVILIGVKAAQFA